MESDNSSSSTKIENIVQWWITRERRDYHGLTRDLSSSLGRPLSQPARTREGTLLGWLVTEDWHSHLISLFYGSNALSPSLSSLFIFPRAPGTRIFRDHSKNHTKAHEPLPLASPLPFPSTGITIIVPSTKIFEILYIHFFITPLHVHSWFEEEQVCVMYVLQIFFFYYFPFLNPAIREK